MRNVKFGLFALLFLVLFIQKASFAYIEGYVFDINDEPLPGVLVSTKDNYNNSEAETYYDGYYFLGSIYSYEQYTVKFEKQGYKTLTKILNNNEQAERITMVAITDTDGTITGTWVGWYEIPKWDYKVNFTMDLEQNGHDVTGDGITSDECKGAITGSIEGDIITFELEGEKSGECCKSKWEGTAILTCSQDHMVMTFTVKDKCNGKAVGSGELWKQ